MPVMISRGLSLQGNLTRSLLPSSSRQFLCAIPRTTSHPRKPQHRPLHLSKVGARLPHDPRIDIRSLRATLDAHRAANHAPRIRKLPFPPAPRGKKENGKHPNSKYANIRYVSATAKVLPAEMPSHPRQAGYEGKKVEMLSYWQPGSSHSDKVHDLAPWDRFLIDKGSKVSDFNEKLDAEVKAFAQYISPTEPEKDAIKAVSEDIIQTCGVKQHHAQVIGSQESGLAAPTSDIDINIGSASSIKPRMLGQRGPSPGRPEARKEALKLLNHSLLRFRRKPLTYRVNLINARIPLIDGEHIPTGLHFDITATFDAPQSTFVKDYLHEFPALRPLHLVIRQYLRMRGLESASSQGLGSYATFVMILAIFKLNSGKYESGDTAQPLLDFLQFYSSIDFWFDGVSADPFEVFSKRFVDNSKLDGRDMRDPYRQGRHLIGIRNSNFPYLMCLQDPANPSNDLGKPTILIKHIQASWKAEFEHLMSIQQRWPLENDRTKQDFCLLQNMIGGSYRRFEDSRAGLCLGWPMDKSGLRKPALSGRST